MAKALQQITEDVIADLKQQLEAHPIYAAVDSIDALRCFMEHHIYSVWDFMSLVKFVQGQVAPTGSPWVPPADIDVARFINEMVVAEESDELPNSHHFISHFDMYCLAMEEIGADTSHIRRFVDTVRNASLETALALDSVPAPSRDFMRYTFATIRADKPHLAAASLAMGREHVIPAMFTALLERAGISEAQAPMFHHYLKRHVAIDGEEHGPLSLRLLNGLCHSQQDVDEAIETAREAIRVRIALWDGVLQAVGAARKAAA